MKKLVKCKKLKVILTRIDDDFQHSDHTYANNSMEQTESHNNGFLENFQHMDHDYAKINNNLISSDKLDIKDKDKCNRRKQKIEIKSEYE